jgi:large subunit ribosomal protein L23
MSLIDKLKRKKELTPAAEDATSGTKKGKKADHDHDHDEMSELKPTRAVSIHGKVNQVLVQPLITEKSAIRESFGTYTFMVALAATKLSVKQAVKDVYGVMPSDVRIMNVEGKRVRTGRNLGKRRDWKKAIVTLPKGKTIHIHEGV